MRICIVGAGAIGGIVGAWLVRAGNDVTFIARGETLARLRSEGLRLVSADGREERIAGVRATEAWVTDRPYDAVLLAVKAHQLREVAERLPPLIGPETLVVPMQNGLPFWYFADRSVRCVDPDGVIQRAIDPRGVIGCVVYIAGERVDPAAVKHLSGNRFLIGELDGSRTPRVERLAKTLSAAGFEAPVLDDIRSEVWVKLWGNVAFNPVSALTGATLAEICGDIHGRALVAQLMREAQAVAEKLGVTMRIPLEKRIEGAARVGRHKTSMLQDVEAGRPLEADALVGAVVELGEMVGVPVPTIRAIYQAVKLLDLTRPDATPRSPPGRACPSAPAGRHRS